MRDRCVIAGAVALAAACGTRAELPGALTVTAEEDGARLAADSGPSGQDAAAERDLDDGELPCAIDSGFDGDGTCRLPPDPESGFRLHYGPADHDDPRRVEPFVLEPGESITDCVWLVTPNETERHYDRWQVRARPGVKSVIVQTLELLGLETGSGWPVPCRQTGLWTRLLLGAQIEPDQPMTDVVLSDTPENAGLAFPLAGSEQVLVIVHAVNETDRPLLREAWIDVGYADETEIEEVGGSLYFAPLVSTVEEPATCQLSEGTGAVRLLALSAEGEWSEGRCPASGCAGDSRLTARKVPQDGQPIEIYEVRGAPAFRLYDGGSAGGPVILTPEDRLEMDCEFGVASRYHWSWCRLLGLYAPATSAPPWICGEPF